MNLIIMHTENGYENSDDDDDDDHCGGNKISCGSRSFDLLVLVFFPNIMIATFFD